MLAAGFQLWTAAVCLTPGPPAPPSGSCLLLLLPAAFGVASGGVAGEAAATVGPVAAAAGESLAGTAGQTAAVNHQAAVAGCYAAVAAGADAAAVVVV